MLKVLIVDDNKKKSAEIKEFLLSFPEIGDEDVALAEDIASARIQLRNTRFDLLILDLMLPERAGESPRPHGGEGLLAELNTSIRLQRPYHIIGLTEHSDLKDTFLDQFQDELWFIIQFGPNLGWRKPLRKKVSYLLESKRTLGAQEISTYQYDLAVIAALHDPELAKVKPFIKEIERFRVDRDTDYYFRGFFERDGKRISVVAAAAPQMGMTASAVLATKMIKHFRPRYLGMVGIAAGVNGQCNLGDILVADRVWDYGSGKIKTDKTRGKVFQPDPKQIPLDFDLLAKFQDIALDKTLFDEIQKDYSGPSEIKSKLKVVIGPLASGAAVVQHEETVKEILDKNRKLVGLEMETYAVFYAAEYSDAPRPLPFSIKSACDFANKKKNDKFQDYAAHTSAQFLYYFATSNLME